MVMKNGETINLQKEDVWVIFELLGLRVFVLGKQVQKGQHSAVLGSRKSHKSAGFGYQTLAGQLTIRSTIRCTDQLSILFCYYY